MAFVNYKQNDWAKLFLIAEFAYNNTKSASTSHRSFKLNYGYHLRISYKEDIDLHSKSKLANKQSIKYLKFMTVSRKNLQHVQKL